MSRAAARYISPRRFVSSEAGGLNGVIVFKVISPDFRKRNFARRQVFRSRYISQPADRDTADGFGSSFRRGSASQQAAWARRPSRPIGSGRLENRIDPRLRLPDNEPFQEP